MEDLPGNEPFEAAEDLPLGEAFLGAFGGVGLGWLMPAESDDSDAVQGCIGLPVAAPVQAMTVGLARAGW